MINICCNRYPILLTQSLILLKPGRCVLFQITEMGETPSNAYDPVGRVAVCLQHSAFLCGLHFLNQASC